MLPSTRKLHFILELQGRVSEERGDCTGFLGLADMKLRAESFGGGPGNLGV